jgi:cytochrome oxidase assembly protein ShyY1
MIGLLALFLVLAAICGSLGAWQLSRAYQRGAASQEKKVESQQAVEHADGADGLGTVLAPQAPFTNAMQDAYVWVQGTYEPSGQLLVPGSTLHGKVGYLVLTPMRVSDDGTNGKSWASLSGAPVVPVVRGWVAEPSDASAPPTGTVRVSGYLSPSEESSGMKMPSGQIDAVSSAVLINRWRGPIYGGYVNLSSSDPRQDASIAVIPKPSAGGTSLNLQSLSYTFQWWLFALFAFFVWWRIVRDQRDHENAELAAAGADEGPDAAPGGVPGAAPGARSIPKRGEDGGIAGLPAKRG